MKLYNKIIGILFVLCSTLCFSTEQHESYEVKILKLPDVSEEPRFSDKPEVHMLCCDGLPDFERYPIEELKSFSEEVSLERRAIFDAAFGSDKDIRLITTNSIVHYIQRKEPERFETFIRTYGSVEDLLKNAKMISEAFIRTSKIYVKEKESEYIIKKPAPVLSTEYYTPYDREHCYEKFEILNPNDYRDAVNKIVDLTSKTEFGRKTLTIFLLCHYCLGHPIFGKDLDLMIGIGDFESDYPVITVDFEETELRKYEEYIIPVYDINLRKVDRIKGFYTYSEMFCHELNHATHFILGRVNYSVFQIQQYLEYPFLRELMANGFEEIKTRLKEAILEKIKTKKDLRDVFCDSFDGYYILRELEKQGILKNKELVCDLMYNDTLNHFQDSLEKPREPGVTYYPIETMLINEIRYKGGPSEKELSTKGFDGLKLILKKTIFKWLQTQGGVDDILSWRYREWYPGYYPTLCGFLKSLDEEVLEEKDSVCEPFFNEKMNDLICSIFENAEETNNILGIELIDGILFINEFSDIYNSLSKRKPFRFGYIVCNNLGCSFIFHEKDAVSNWLKKSINDILTLNTPSERSIDALLQLHGF